LSAATVKNRQRNPDREKRIHEEIIVDAYGPEEQAMGWHYHLENKLRFPFQARCIASNLVSSLKQGEIVEVLQMAPEEACSGDMLVLIRWQDRTMAVPLSQLSASDADDDTLSSKKQGRDGGRDQIGRAGSREAHLIDGAADYHPHGRGDAGASSPVFGLRIRLMVKKSGPLFFLSHKRQIGWPWE
jgi:Calcium binding